MGARAGDAGPGLDLREKAFEAGGVLGADFNHVRSLPGDRVAFEDLIDAVRMLYERVVMLRRVDDNHDEGGNILPESSVIDGSAVARNESPLLELAEPLTHRRHREANRVGKIYPARP